MDPRFQASAKWCESFTAEQFEQWVETLLRGAGEGELQRLDVKHRALVPGLAGEYEIDVLASFTAFGEAEFLVLVECKNWRKAVTREVVQVLRDRLVETGASKGLIFATGGFQSGAIRYAAAHRIALVYVTDGNTTWITKSSGEHGEPPQWAGIPPVSGWLSTVEDGREGWSLVEERRVGELRYFLGLGNKPIEEEDHGFGDLD